MPMSSAKQEKIINHLRTKHRGACPHCGEREMSVENELHFLGTLDAEYKQPIEGSVFPVATVICNNCFYAFHLSAMKLDLL